MYLQSKRQTASVALYAADIIDLIFKFNLTFGFSGHCFQFFQQLRAVGVWVGEGEGSCLDLYVYNVY